MRMLTTVCCVLFVTDPLHALQLSINWIDDSEAGVAASQKSSLAILFLVLPQADAPAAVEQKAERSFEDPAVISLVRERFVAVRLRKSKTAAVLLRRLNAVDAPLGSAVIATPGGSGVDIIAPQEVQDAQLLVARLAEAFRKYQSKVLADSVAPVFQNGAAKPEALLKALQLIKDLELSDADKAMAQVLDRKELPDAVRSAAYDTLAALSTERSVGILLSEAMRNAGARDGLRLCTPAGAAALLPALKLDDRERLMLAYDALVSICSIENPKLAEFWQTDDEVSQQTEIDRVKEKVAACAKASLKARV